MPIQLVRVVDAFADQRGPRVEAIWSARRRRSASETAQVLSPDEHIIYGGKHEPVENRKELKKYLNYLFSRPNIKADV